MIHRLPIYETERSALRIYVPGATNRMKIYDILDKLQFEIENAANVPLTNKVMIDKDEILDMIDELRSTLPEDISQAQKIKESENRIKLKAAEEAKNILEQAKEHKAKMIDTSTITKSAYDEADAIIKDANAEVARMRLKSIDYVSGLLTKAQEDLAEVIKVIDSNKNELKDKRRQLTGNRPVSTGDAKSPQNQNKPQQ